jgi:hypothetical protein
VCSPGHLELINTVYVLEQSTRGAARVDR